MECEFLNSYPNKRSLAQHIRNQHAPEANKKRAEEAASEQSRFWSNKEHALFLDALDTLGPGSNIAIAQFVGSKSTKQVGMHKKIFLKHHPKLGGNFPQTI